MKDYQALADQHSKEIVKLLEDFSVSQVETTCNLQEYEAERKAVAQGNAETVELPDSDSSQHSPAAQEKPQSTTPASEPTSEATPDLDDLPQDETP